MKNEELIKALRWCGGIDEQHEMCVDASYSCPIWNEDRMTDYCKADLMLAAADALEAAEKRIADLETALAACVRKEDNEDIVFGYDNISDDDDDDDYDDWFCADGERKEQSE